MLGVLVLFFGWLWLDARKRAVLLEDAQPRVVSEALDRQEADNDPNFEEAQARIMKVVRRQVNECVDLLNNYAGAERQWMQIIRGLTFGGQGSQWAERQRNGVLQSYFADIGGGDRREATGEACGLRRRGQVAWALDRLAWGG